MAGLPSDNLSLTPKQRQAAALIASGQSQRQVAMICGVTPQTMTTWAHTPAFSSHVESLLGTVERQTQQALHGLRLGAVETLAHLLDTGTPGARLQAARIILEATHRPYDLLAGANPVERHQTEHFRDLMAVIEGKKANVIPEPGIN